MRFPIRIEWVGFGAGRARLAARRRADAMLTANLAAVRCDAERREKLAEAIRREASEASSREIDERLDETFRKWDNFT